MQKLLLSSLKCIKSNAVDLVKLEAPFWSTQRFSFLLVISILMLTRLSLSWGASPPHSRKKSPPPPIESNAGAARAPAATQVATPVDPPSPTPVATETDIDNDIDPEIENEKLPEIEAKTYALKVLDRSKSNKVYLFEDTSNQQPNPGRILLLKREDEKFMAFRVLKNYPDKKTLAAKRIRKYGAHKILEAEESFMAIEKLSDLNIPPTKEDKSDLAELEAKMTISVYDPELDKGTSPLPNGQEIKKEDDENEINAELAPDVEIDQGKIIDHYLHWLSAGLGFVKNSNSSSNGGGSHFFSAGNIRYGISLGRMVFMDQPKLQDSIVLEGGIYTYKTLNFEIQGDAYSVLSFNTAMRYNILFSETFGIFFYTGVLLNYVVASVQSNPASTKALSSILPTGGGGLLFQVGPSWYTRVDIGIESVGLSLVLRF